MKIKIKMKLTLALVILLGLWEGCAPPKATTSYGTALDKETLTLTQKEASGLWVATSDYQSGSLGRLDLESGKFNPLVLPINADSRILPDGPSGKGLFLLSRMQNDSIQLLQGAEAKVVAELPLPQGINPQFAYRAADESIWTVNLDSNFLDIYSPLLEKKIKSIDLSGLKDSFDPYAELAYIGPLGHGSHLTGVLAQRLRRKYSGMYWVPEARGGLAFIDDESRELKGVFFPELANPVGFFATNLQGPPDQGDSFQLYGSGDLSPADNFPGKEGLFSLTLGEGTMALSNSHLGETDGRILDFAMAHDKTALVLWKPKDKSSCIVFGSVPLVCEKDDDQGYIFEKVVLTGKLIFASYRKGGQSELWVIPTEGGATRKIPMNQPIISLSPGP